VEFVKEEPVRKDKKDKKDKKKKKRKNPLTKDDCFLLSIVTFELLVELSCGSVTTPRFLVKRLTSVEPMFSPVLQALSLFIVDSPTFPTNNSKPDSKGSPKIMAVK
jgi:hypothetical protein